MIFQEGGFLATNLKKVTVPVVSDEDCNKVFKIISQYVT